MSHFHGSFLVEIALAVSLALVFASSSGRTRLRTLAAWYSTNVPSSVTTWVSLVAGLAVATVSFAADGAPFVPRVHFTAALLLLQLVATGLPLVEAAHVRDQVAQADAVATTAVREATRDVNKSLVPLAGLVKTITEPSVTSMEQQRMKGQAHMVTLTAAALLMGGPDNIRASWFVASGVKPTRTLTPPSSGASIGRADMAHTVFEETTTLGATIFQALDDRKVVYVDNILTNPPPGWVAAASPPVWRSFVSAPVVYDGQLMGMLTVDSLVEDDFDQEQDTGLAIALTDLLATAMNA